MNNIIQEIDIVPSILSTSEKQGSCRRQGSYFEVSLYGKRVNKERVLFEVVSILRKKIRTTSIYWQKITKTKHPTIKGKEGEVKITFKPQIITEKGVREGKRGKMEKWKSYLTSFCVYLRLPVVSLKF